jgi:hypothetical protein
MRCAVTCADAPPPGRWVGWIWCFGNLIANTDMHRASASFWFTDEMPFKLAPCYEMLPMLYAPGVQGELGEREFVPRPPGAGVLDVWPDAARAAVEFWHRVTGEPRVSDSFRATAEENRVSLERALARFG